MFIIPMVLFIMRLFMSIGLRLMEILIPSIVEKIKTNTPNLLIYAIYIPISAAIIIISIWLFYSILREYEEYKYYQESIVTLFTILRFPRIQLGQTLNFVPYFLGASTLLPTIVVTIILIQGFFLHYLALAIRLPILVYLRAISRMKKPVLILIGSTPLLLGGIISAIQVIVSSR